MIIFKKVVEIKSFWTIRCNQPI